MATTCPFYMYKHHGACSSHSKDYVPSLTERESYCLKKISFRSCPLYRENFSNSRATRLIKVIYADYTLGTVKDIVLDRLISEGKVRHFYREGGWATVGHDPVRTVKSGYTGAERRRQVQRMATV